VDDLNGGVVHKVDCEGVVLEAGSGVIHGEVRSVEITNVGWEEFEIVRLSFLSAVQESVILFGSNEIHVLVVVDEGFSKVIKVFLFTEKALRRELYYGFRSIFSGLSHVDGSEWVGYSLIDVGEDLGEGGGGTEAEEG